MDSSTAGSALSASSASSRGISVSPTINLLLHETSPTSLNATHSYSPLSLGLASSITKENRSSSSSSIKIKRPSSSIFCFPLNQSTSGGGTPITRTSNLASALGKTLIFFSSSLKSGLVSASSTRSSASLDALPSSLRATHLYSPSSSSSAGLNDKEAKLPSKFKLMRSDCFTFSPSLNHSILGCGSPFTSHSKFAGLPSTTVRFWRGVKISGAIPFGFSAVKEKTQAKKGIVLQ